MQAIERQRREARNRGHEFARMIQCLAAAKGDLMLAAELAKGRHDPRVAKTFEGLMRSSATLTELITKSTVQPGTTSDTSWASALAPIIPISQAFCQYVYPMTIIGRLDGLRTVPFQAQIPKTISGIDGAADFVGQSAPIPVAAMAFDTLRLAYAKLAVIVLLTQDLVRFSAPDAQATIVDDCARAVQAGMDRAFLDPTRAQVDGSDGMISPASVTYGALQIPSSGNTAIKLTDDAQLALLALDAARINIPEVVWIMDQRTAVHIAGLRTSTGAPAFPDFKLNGGEWVAGLPVLVSAALNDLGGNSPTTGLIVALHAPSIMVADTKLADISLSTQAAVRTDSPPSAGPAQLVSLYGSNFVGIRIQRWLNWQRRREGSVVAISGITI